MITVSSRTVPFASTNWSEKIATPSASVPVPLGKVRRHGHRRDRPNAVEQHARPTPTLTTGPPAARLVVPWVMEL